MLRLLHKSLTRSKILPLGLMLGGCAIAESTIVDRSIPIQPGTIGCSSRLGSYALPKGFIHVVIGKSTTGNDPPDLVTKLALDDPNTKFNFEITRRPDPALTICLDYLASGFAHDQVNVIKQDADPADPTKSDNNKDNGTDA